MPYPRPLRRAAFSTACAAFALACSGEPPDEGVAEPDPTVGRHTSWRRLRALVADAATGRLSVFDAEDDEIIATLDVGAPAALAATDTGNHAIAQLPDLARFVDAGVSIVDHVDHIHIYKFEPKLRPFAMPGERARFASNEGWLAGAFAPGGGSPSARVVAVREDDVAKQGAPPTLTFDMGAEPPFAAFPLGGGFVVPHGAPFGGAVSVEAWPPPPGAPTTLGACPGLGGATGAGPRAAFACEDGILLAYHEAGAYVPTRIAYPPGAFAPRRLLAHPALPIIVGDLGPRALLIVDGSAPAAWPIELPGEACDFFLEPARGEQVVILTTDGALFTIDMASGGVKKRVDIVAPFTCAEGAARPHLAAAPERAYVTDPGAGKLYDVDLNRGRVALELDVGGAPNEVIVLGLDLRNANVAPGAAHDGF